jgi:DNA polymerase-1
MILVVDVEANGLLDTVSKLWQISIIDVESGRLSSYNRDTLPAGLAHLQKADKIIMHHGLGYDVPVIEICTGIKLDPTKIIDTLVLSRLARPDRPGGHSIAAWGERFGLPKPVHEDWSKWSPEMQVRCDEDAKITMQVYKTLERMLTKYPGPVAMEHFVAWETSKMSMRGIALNVDLCVSLASKFRGEQEEVLKDVRETFKPILIPKEASASKRARTLKNVNKRHPLYGMLEPGHPYCPLKVQEFNPGSRQQVADRLVKKYGWKPMAFTPGGAPEISEETLGELPYPEAQIFARYLKIEKLIGFIEGEPDAKGNGGGWLHHERNGRVHPQFNPLGTITSRPSCSSPNLQQVPVRTEEAKLLRSAFIPSKGRKLVGVDASGIELRMLAHYLARFDGGAYAREVVDGDIHTKVMNACGFDRGDPKIGRQYIKNIEYGMIYGAGNHKLGTLAKKNARAQDNPLEGNERTLGKKIRAKVKETIPGYEKLEEGVKEKAKSQGWIKGLDGRRIWLRSEHSALNFLLQSAGIIVIKQAMVEAPAVLAAAGLVEDVDYFPLLWVHDEWQVECRPEVAEQVGEILASTFVLAGQTLGVRCRLDGEYKIGSTWADTH